MTKRIYDELKPLFRPQSIAIIGASNTPGKWGNDMVARPLQSSFRGAIYPINPKAKEIEGLDAYPNLGAVSGPVDMAIITVPAPKVPDTVRDCAAKGVKAMVIISAGFAETGPEGKALQEEVVKIAKSANIRFMGPNGMGIYVSGVRLNTAFDFMPQKGGISFISQSGTMGAFLMAVASDKGYGFNSFLSVGNQADLSMADYIEYLGEDSNTKVIVLYIEGLKDAHRFLVNAREVVKKKPIVVYKSGLGEDGARAAMSHTASIAGSDHTFDAACHQAGIIRTYDVSHAFDIAEALSKQPLPKGNRVGIVASGGGMCVVCADACNGYGLRVPELDSATVKKLSPYLLPHAAPPKNPIDLAADPRGMTIAEIAEELAAHSEIDAIIADAPLWGISPETVKEKLDAAEKLSLIPRKFGKPLIVLTMRRHMTGIVYELMRDRNIPFYEFPKDSARAVYGLYMYSRLKIRNQNDNERD
ncbi:MAG: CoA-binding protein [Syntrophales bacterium]|jgi:acetyltransferase|nr:CoA-binding protein [Syntrophales bacterium]MDY0043035.1 CoA-binding protein [Syntrophales bacterium]